MAEELVMPRLSDTMESGTVSRWLKAEGEAFVTGDVLAEIETDKAVMELSAYDDGVLLQILVGDGESADLGAPIALVGEEGEEREERPESASDEDDPEAAAEASDDEEATTDATAASDDEPGETTAAPEPEPASIPDRASEGDAPPARSLKASPIARRIALDADVDLRALAGKGSGPDGRIVKADVERLIEGRDRKADAGDDKKSSDSGAKRPSEPAKPPSPKQAKPEAADDAEFVKPSRMLQTIARRMQQSKQTAPHFYLETSVDMTNALAARRQVNQTFGESSTKVSVNDLMLRAAALALVAHPQFHRSWTDDGIIQHSAANIGMAVALDEGLIVPVVRDVAAKSLRVIASETKDLAERARAGRLKQPEIEGGTFTVSNLGMFGITRFNAIINLPEPGILSVAAAVDTPVVSDGQIVVRPIMALSLSVDHRAASGAVGARFLATLKRILESGAGILA